MLFYVFKKYLKEKIIILYFNYLIINFIKNKKIINKISK